MLKVSFFFWKLADNTTCSKFPALLTDFIVQGERGREREKNGKVSKTTPMMNLDSKNWDKYMGLREGKKKRRPWRDIYDDNWKKKKKREADNFIPLLLSRATGKLFTGCQTRHYTGWWWRCTKGI